MPIEILKNLENIAKKMKYKYAKQLHQMIFVFCYKRPDGRSFIFQELTAVPIQRFVYHPSNDSISFTAGWSAWGNPYSLIADGRHGGTEVWKDLFDRSKPNNTNINQFGSFNADEWTLINRSNVHETEKKKKTKFDTVFEFRTDRIERVCLYRRWFEVISSSLSFMALDPHMLFPYQMDVSDLPGFNINDYDAPTDVVGEDYDEDDDEDYDDEDFQIVKCNGKSFDFGIKSGIEHTPDAYWDRNECDPENKEFDEYLFETLVKGNRKAEGSINVGQRKTNLYFEE